MRYPARSARAVAGSELSANEPREADALDAGGVGRQPIVVDQHRKRDPLVRDEGPRVAKIAGSDHHDLGALSAWISGVPVAQLRGVLAAMQSAEVAREDQHDAALAPEIAESAAGAPLASGSESAESRWRSIARDSRGAGGAGYGDGSRAAVGFPGIRRRVLVGGPARTGGASLRARPSSCRTNRNAGSRRSGGPRRLGCRSPQRSGSAVVRTGRRLSRGLPEP